MTQQPGATISAEPALDAARVAAAQGLEPIELPLPLVYGNRSLTAALKLRRSTREYADRPLPLQLLSDLLWAAFGVNRPGGDRTAPYWRHVMVLDIYVAMADGVRLYEPAAHRLLPHLKDDIRKQTGVQDFVSTAPLEMIYVALGERMTDVSPEERRLYASVDAAFIGQNIYLFCASESLGTVFRGSVDHAALARILMLPAEQFVTFAQTVGYPKPVGSIPPVGSGPHT
jgi:nitroreductase